MPRIASGQTEIRPDLGQVAYEYLVSASQRGFIGLEILPVFESALQSSVYPVIPVEAVLKLPETKRVQRAAYPRSDWTFETGTFSCEEHGWEELVDDAEARMYANYFDVEQVATIRAMDIILRSQEKRIADMVFNTSNLSHAAVSTAWSTHATASPQADVEAAKNAMRSASGLLPNTMVLGYNALSHLLQCAEIKDALKYTNPIELGGMEAKLRTLAQFFGVDRVLMGNAIYDSAKKNVAASIADIWDDGYCGLFAVSNGADLRTPQLGRTFLWTEDSPGNLVVETYREEQTRGNVIRVRHNTDEKFIYTGAGYLLTGVTT